MLDCTPKHSTELESKLAIILLPVVATLELPEACKPSLRAVLELLPLGADAGPSEIERALGFAPMKAVQTAVETLIECHHRIAEQRLQQWLYGND